MAIYVSTIGFAKSHWSPVDPIGANYVEGSVSSLGNMDQIWIISLDACSIIEVSRTALSLPVIIDLMYSCAIFLMCDAIVYVRPRYGEP